MGTPSRTARALGRPTVRPLKVYAFDPSAGRFLGNDMTVSVEYEPLEPGPIGKGWPSSTTTEPVRPITNRSILTTTSS
jgi:hypothetical protein